MKDLFGENYIGKFGGADWNELQELPAFTLGTFVPSSTTTITSTITTEGATTINLSNAGLTGASTLKKGTVFFVNGVKTLDLNNVETQEQYAFIVTADSVGAAGTIDAIVNPIYFAKGAAKNVSVSQLTAGTACIASTQTAGSTYRVIQVRDSDALAFDQYDFPELPGADTTSESVGKFKVEGAAIGNVLTRDATYRFDMPYISELVHSKLARLAFVKVS
jgi:hypothetical protein